MAKVFIVGANRGIGLELARACQLRGDQVLVACRSSSAALGELGVEIVENIDVRSESLEVDLRSKLGDQKFEIVLVVSGILERNQLQNLDLKSIRRQFEVNALGPLRIVEAIQTNLAEGCKVGLLTSRMGSIADNTSGSHYGYRMSKAALNMAGRSLALDLAPRNISVVLLHPGFVRTDMTKGQGNVDAEASARDLLLRIDELKSGDSGSFVHASGEKLPW